MSVADTFELTLALLTVIVGLYWLALTLRLPPSAALLVGSGALAFVPGLPHFVADPDLVLVLFLPPLLMDGAFSTSLGRFRRQLPGILSLAIGMVVFTTLAVGVVTHWLVPSLPWAACFALGAIVSPPDAVSARAVLQSVTLPRRLTALIEGESLVNDATGLVLFRFAVAATLSPASGPTAPAPACQAGALATDAAASLASIANGGSAPIVASPEAVARAWLACRPAKRCSAPPSSPRWIRPRSARTTGASSPGPNIASARPCTHGTVAS